LFCIWARRRRRRVLSRAFFHARRKETAAIRLNKKRRVATKTAASSTVSTHLFADREQSCPEDRLQPQTWNEPNGSRVDSLSRDATLTETVVARAGYLIARVAPQLEGGQGNAERVEGRAGEDGKNKMDREKERRPNEGGESAQYGDERMGGSQGNIVVPITGSRLDGTTYLAIFSAHILPKMEI